MSSDRHKWGAKTKEDYVTSQICTVCGCEKRSQRVHGYWYISYLRNHIDFGEDMPVCVDLNDKSDLICE